MAPRANWKGFLRLSLVTCPVALYPATSESEKVSFNQLNRKTGHRIKYAKVDADTGEEVANEDIVKGYKVDTDTFIEVTKEELENVALESTRTIEIDEFVDHSEIDVPPSCAQGYAAWAGSSFSPVATIFSAPSSSGRCSTMASPRERGATCRTPPK